MNRDSRILMICCDFQWFLRLHLNYDNCISTVHKIQYLSHFSLQYSKLFDCRAFAFKQMERAGAILTTSECVILGLCGGADHPKFKQV